MSSQEVGLAQVMDNIVMALEQQEFGIAEQLLTNALNQFPHMPGLWYYASIAYFGLDNFALSMLCGERAIELEPLAPAYANICAAYRRLGMYEAASQAIDAALELDDQNCQTWNNKAALYVNEGNPEEGLKAARRAVELSPGFARGYWNKALLELEAGNYGEGFQNYRWGMGKDRVLKQYGELPYLPQDYRLNSKVRPRLIVTGEQGIGDELMFATLLNLAQEHFEITYDCHPRLLEIFQRRWPDLDIRPTRKIDPAPWLNDWLAETANEERFHCSIADLAGYYIRDYHDFTDLWVDHGPFYAPDPYECSAYRAILEELAEGRRIIGVATRGGGLKTNRFYRTMRPKDLEPLWQDKRFMYVSLDYEPVDAMIEGINQEYGEGTIHGFRAITHHFNYDHTAALVAATDATVTICQSVFHLSAAMGHPTFCLVPDKPAWRYGQKGKKHFWYQDRETRLYRQKPGESWKQPVRAMFKMLETI